MEPIAFLGPIAILAGTAFLASRLLPKRPSQTEDAHEFGEDGIRSQTTEKRVCPATGCVVQPNSPLPGCVGEDGSCSHWQKTAEIQVRCVRKDCPVPEPISMKLAA